MLMIIVYMLVCNDANFRRIISRVVPLLTDSFISSSICAHTTIKTINQPVVVVEILSRHRATKNVGECAKTNDRRWAIQNMMCGL